MGTPVRVVVDDAIEGWREAFTPFGEVTAVSSGALHRDHLSGADALIVRSVTHVNSGLLRGTPIRFVASASAGIDHVDHEFLKESGITFAHSPGCNADAVAQWVVAALDLARERGPDPWRRVGRIGIVGFGQVGTRLAARLGARGENIMICDPPRARREGSAPAADYRALGELLEACSVVSFHVPLTRNGPDRTEHLVAEAVTPCLINTSRGAVVANGALAAMPRRTAIVDVWEGEPNVEWTLLREGGPVLIGSPHVAAYTLSAKARATAMVRDAMAGWLSVAVPTAELRVAHSAGRPLDLPADDRSLRAVAALPESERGAAFEALRKNYVLRLD
jgi:erythronate-4-phosphate dehydrogenase